MRIALFGCGRIGKVHAAAIAAHPRAELVRTFDPFEPAAEELAALYGAVASTDVHEVLADDAVDAVLVASSTATHVGLITAAAKAGKPVLCEKPIDLDIAEVESCWAEIEDLAPTVQMGFNRRFDPSFREVHDRVAAGEIGRVEQLVITSRDLEPSPKVYVETSGGMFRDMTIHDFDTARFILGDIVEVHAIGANLIEPYFAECGDIDTAVVMLRAASGALAQIGNSRRCSYGFDQRIEVFGAEGMLTATNQLPTTVRAYTKDRAEAAPPYVDYFLDRYRSSYAAQLDHFVTAVEAGEQPTPSFADGRAALLLADAASESMRTGSAVRL